MEPLQHELLPKLEWSISSDSRSLLKHNVSLQNLFEIKKLISNSRGCTQTQSK
jgi:hypothetical protein